MSLKANIQTNALGDIIIHLNGNINFENQKELQKEVQILEKQHPYSTITLDMNALDFVGSSSISTFVSYLKFLHEKDQNKYKISNVKSEFLRIFSIYGFNFSKMLTNESNEDYQKNFGALS